jgi:SSS family solute:Na+ symporter
MTFFGAAISTFAWYVCTCGSDQMAVQRWLSTRDAAAARRSLRTTLWAEAIVGALLGMVGLAVVGYFTAHPELLTSDVNLVDGADKLFPRFVVVGLPYGMTGVIIAAILSAAMSSLASGMNSSCAVITEDFIGRFRKAPLSDAQRVRLARAISLCIGIVVILVSLLVSRVEGNLVDLCYRVVNLLVAPLFVLFFLAIFVPWATTPGALFGAVASVTAAVCIAFSSSLGLGRLSILWIMPGSFCAGVIAGGFASFVPVGRSRSDQS